MTPTQNPSLPLYKLHEASRAATFADSNRMVIEPNATPVSSIISHIQHHRQAQQQQQQQQQQQRPQHGSPTKAQVVPSASIQPHPPQQQQQQQPQKPPPRVITKTNRNLPQSSSPPESPSVDQPANMGATTIANAHFGHSLYFIEHLFPSKLWRILDDAERFGYDSIISWVDNGMAFQIHDRENVIPILEKYFNMSKYKSFLRQLQAYGFQRALPNPKDDPLRDSKGRSNSYRGKWSHKLFRRDKMNLCNKMTRDGKSKQDKEQSVQQQKQQNDKISKGHAIQKVVPPRVVSSGPPIPSHSPTLSSINGNLTQQQQQQQLNQSQVTIAKHHQQQRELAAMSQQHQQQQHHQHQLQLMHKQILQQQQQQQQQAPPGLYHHDPRYPSQQHSPPRASFHHPQHHPAPPGAPQPQHHGAPPPATTGTSGLSPSLLARVQHQQEENARQQLKIQLQHMKEQQLLSSILAKTRAPEAAAAAASNTLSPKLSSIPSAPTSSTAPTVPESQSLLAARNYNRLSPVPPSAAVNGVIPSTAKTASDAVTEAAYELHRAELVLIERRKRLLEAQERAQKEAEALAKAEAAVLAHSRGIAEAAVAEPAPSSVSAPAPTPEPSIASSTTAAAKELSLRQSSLTSDATSSVKPPPTSSSMALMSSEAEKAGTAKIRMIKGHPLTSLLEDLDNAFKSSTAAKLSPPQSGDAGNKASAVLSNGAIPNADAPDQLKITEEELLRVRAEAAAAVSANASAPSQTDHILHRPQHGIPPSTSSGPSTAAALATGKTSPEPSASEREVIMARLNAMEQIRIREHQQQQQTQQQLQQKQQQAHMQQKQQLMMMNMALAEREEQHQQESKQQQQQQKAHKQQLLIAMAERKERERIRRGVIGAGGPVGTGEANAAVANAASSAAKAAVRDAIRNATVGLDPSAANRMIQNPPHGSSILPPAQQPPSGLLSKEMMDIFAKTAAAAISSKSGDGSGSDKNSAAPVTAGKRDASQISTDSSSPSHRHKKPASSSTTGSPVRPSDAPSIASITAAPQPESSVVTNSELEAARALMRFPGSVSQPNEKPMAGHWELVRQEELKSGTTLAKTLPDAVTKSAEMSYDAYKSMACKLTPPPVMRIPDGWNARKEPVYLVVNPASATARAPLPPGSMAMAMNAPTAAPTSLGAQGSVDAAQLLNGRTAGAPGLH